MLYSAYWNSKGENEIDLVALNDFDKTAIVAEIKRNTGKIDLQALATKTADINKALSKYKITLRALSLDDM